jgi:hypothetical protein
MFAFLQTIINWSTMVLNMVLVSLDVVDTLICDWEGIVKTGITDSIVYIPPSKIWVVLVAFSNFMCHAYTYKGVGISYTVAREVLSVRKQFEDLQEQYPETDIIQLYTVYTKTRCLTRTGDAAFVPLLHRLLKIRCIDVKNLTVQRAYDHPVFGLRYGDATLSELVVDAKITVFDMSGILARVFDEHEEDMD